MYAPNLFSFTASNDDGEENAEKGSREGGWGSEEKQATNDRRLSVDRLVVNRLRGGRWIDRIFLVSL